MKIGRSISTQIDTHAALKTGVHGVGAKYLAISSGSNQKITNVDVDNAAAIAYSKLNLALAVKNTDIALAAGIVYSKLNLALRIVDADIKADAAIAGSKIDGDFVESGQVVIWTGTIATIPSGWVICDGNNDTDDLLALFLQGVATAATNPGATGGATAKTTDGHQHDLPLTELNSTTPLLNINIFGTGANIAAKMTHGFSSDTSTKAAGLAKSKTDSISDIRPLFFDVAFIMKT